MRNILIKKRVIYVCCSWRFSVNVVDAGNVASGRHLSVGAEIKFLNEDSIRILINNALVLSPFEVICDFYKGDITSL